MKKIVAFLLSLLMVLGMTACGARLSDHPVLGRFTERMNKEDEKAPASSEEDSPAEEKPEKEDAPEMEEKPGEHIDSGFELKKVGEFTDEDGLGILRGVLTARNGDEGTVYDVYGEEIMTAKDWNMLSNGMYEIRADDEDINCVGLFTPAGEEILPCEAGMIELLNDRFTFVYYATGTTNDKDECLFYSSDSVSLNPDGDDVMYKGFIRVYDVEQKRFLEGLEIDRLYVGGYQECGDSFSITAEDRTERIYDSEGNVRLETEDYLVAGYNHWWLVRDDAGASVEIYDSNMNPISTDVAASEIDALAEFSPYILSEGDDRCKILTLDGQVVGEVACSYMNELTNGVFCFSQPAADGGLYDEGLVLADGTVILEAGLYDRLTYEGYGIFRGTDEDGSYVYISLDGEVVSQAELTDDHLVINYGTMTVEQLQAETESELEFGLRGIYDSEKGSRGLYDQLRGRELLPCEYARIYLVDDYVLAEGKDDVWTIYELIRPET